VNRSQKLLDNGLPVSWGLLGTTSTSQLPTTRKVTVEIDQTIALKIPQSAFINSVQSGPRQAIQASTLSCNPRQVVRNGPARPMSPAQRSMLASLSICEL